MGHPVRRWRHAARPGADVLARVCPPGTADARYARRKVTPRGSVSVSVSAW